MYWGGVRYRAIVAGSVIVFGYQVQRVRGVTTGKHQESMSALVSVEDEQDGEQTEVWVLVNDKHGEMATTIAFRNFRT